ncbi:MAG: leucine-rich repeat protein SHOC2 [Crocinitomicaceae bacterium]|jgi:leucine-rich repeat protein SHOC2
MLVHMNHLMSLSRILFSSFDWMKVSLVPIFCFSFCNLQAQLLDSTELAEQPTYKYIQYALKHDPDSVYKLDISIRKKWNEKDTSLIQEIRKFKNLQELQISGDAVSEDTLPEFITKLPNLQILLLKSYGHLPVSIENLKSLEALYLLGPINELPDELGKLKNLKKLYISCTAKTIPESMGDLTNLEELILYYNSLTEIPKSIGRLKNLRLLQISGTQINEIPSEIRTLKKLTRLEIRSNQKLSSLPDELFTLSSLKTLILYNNYMVKEISTDFHLLKNLERLEIVYGGFSELPKMSGMDKLSYLEIVGNDSLSTLPESLNDLKSLKELKLTYGYLNGLPLKLNKLDQLKYLTIQQRGDFNWEESMKSLSKCKQLESLDISRNSSPFFPENIVMLSSMKRIKFIQSKPYTRPTVPEWDRITTILTGMKQLSTLDISGYRLSELPPAIGAIKTLDSLYLGMHNFSNAKLTFSILSQLNLKLLSMYDCRLDSLPEEIGLLTSLEKLDLREIDIDSLPDYLGKLVHLTHLDVSRYVHSPGSDFAPHYPDNGRAHCIGYISTAVYSIPTLRELSIKGAVCPELTKEEILKELPKNCLLIYDH